MNNTMSNSTGNSYGSITPAMDANASVDVNASTPTPRSSSSSSSRRQSHRRGPSMLKVMLGASACLCGMMILIATNMDSEMYDKFQALGFSVSHMRAQLTADKVHLNTPLLSRGSSVTGSKKQKKQQDHEQQHPHAPEGCEGTVLLIRHCEKLNLKSHCDYVGFERSVFLATLFGHTVKDRWPAPSTLYALRPGHRHNPHKMNYRELETVDAIADKFELQVNDDYSTHATGQLARDVLETVKQGDICGKLVVVSWKHSDLPNLARKLGCGPLEGCPLDYKGKEFDQVWQIKYVYRKFSHKGKMSKHAYWKTFGSVQNEGFDPLSFSKLMGDYPQGGTQVGARWKPLATTNGYART